MGIRPGFFFADSQTRTPIPHGINLFDGGEGKVLDG